ncbi:MAG: 2'-5' RNA ligase [Achromobacter sp.]|uniref:2'-5' RNA ligase n=1 Tax=Achromobacter sp. TaxID=134375 RepID=UPI003D008AA0
MNDWPIPNFPLEQFRALSLADKELCLAMIRAYCAEIALQEQIGMRPSEDDLYSF